MDAQTAKRLLEDEQVRLHALERGLGEAPDEGAQADNGSSVFENEKDRSIRHQVARDLRDVADALAASLPTATAVARPAASTSPRNASKPCPPLGTAPSTRACGRPIG